MELEDKEKSEMKKAISWLLGLEFIQHVAAKKVARVVAAALIVLAGKSKVVAAILVAAGVTSASMEAALIVALLAGLEALRGWAKHSDKPTATPAG